MNEPKITVIVPIYKVEKYLVQCIDSILAQTLKDIEVILVDEGDLDLCRAIIDMYEFGGKKDLRIRTIHEKNGGYGASVNKGMDIARGEYISIIESDDFIEPTMYEEMYEYAKKLDADVVKTPYYEYWEKTSLTPEKKKICNYAEYIAEVCPKDKTFSVLDYPQLMSIHASLWSGIYKTSYMRKKNIRFIEAKGGAYVDVGFRIDTLINTDKVAWLDKAFYNYRLTNETSTTNNFNLTAMLQRWEEAHKKFVAMPEIYEKVGPELVLEEYLNTAAYLFNDYPVTQAHIAKMQELFNYIPDSVIKNSTCLTDLAKKTMLDLKYGNITRKRKIKWYSSSLKIHKKKTSIYLFRKLNTNIIRSYTRILKNYIIDFSIGKIERKLILK